MTPARGGVIRQTPGLTPTGCPYVRRMSEKPEIDFPGEPAPTTLQIRDLVEGDGTEAAPGRRVSVHYVGVAHSTGEEFDASYNRGEPLTFPLGAGRVIRGWDFGIAGMRVGGRRQLTIPPDLAYGDRGRAT